MVSGLFSTAMETSGPKPRTSFALSIKTSSSSDGGLPRVKRFSMSSTNILEFLMLVGKLKNVKRTGWINHNVKKPESVADHMYRMAIMTFLLNNPSAGVNNERCLKLAVVHDLAECIVGDITPSDPMGHEEKHRREKDAMNHLASLIDSKEYESQTTSEAKAVKDLDRFEMILQAFEYEKAEDRHGELQDFFNSTKDKFKTPQIKEWVEELGRKREEQRTMHFN
eukprot:gene8258-14207_t